MGLKSINLSFDPIGQSFLEHPCCLPGCPHHNLPHRSFGMIRSWKEVLEDDSSVHIKQQGTRTANANAPGSIADPSDGFPPRRPLPRPMLRAACSWGACGASRRNRESCSRILWLGESWLFARSLSLCLSLFSLSASTLLCVVVGSFGLIICPEPGFDLQHAHTCFACCP